jgi:two-component sensor histidine kinase
MTSDKNARVAPLDEHINRIVRSFESGLAPDNILISVQSEAIILDQQCNLVIGLIVSEWMTNSIKYAFRDHPGRISVSVARGGSELVVVVADDGQAMASDDVYPGTGSRLVRSLATTIGARVESEVSHGTRCSLILPVGA